MKNTYNFKRFVTFGLGLGMFMSASSGFAQTIAASNTITAVNGSLLLQGTNSAGVATQSVSISNVGHISGRSADFNGADGVSAVKLTMSNGGTISGSAQVVTIDAVGNGNIKLMDSTQVQGNITATGTISTSQAIQTTGTGSINSAFNLTAAGNKFNVAGDTGNVSTTGSVTAATGNFGGAGVGAGLVGVGAGNKIVLNGNNGNATVSGVALLLGGAYVAPRADDASLPALTVNGQGAFKGINNAGQKITGVGAGTASTDAVNKGQLDTVNDRLSGQVVRLDGQVARIDGLVTKTDATNAALNTEVARAKAAEVALGGRIDTETNTRVSEVARVDGRIDTTNTRVTTEVSRLDGRIDVTNAALNTEVSTRISEVARVEGRVVTVEGKTQNIIATSGVTNVSGQLNTDGIDNGGKTITNVAAGVAYNDVANVGQLNAVENRSTAYTDKAVAAESSRAQAAEAAISKEVKQVGAMAMAAAAVGAATPQGDNKTAVSVALGSYSGQTAVAIGVNHLVKPNFRAFGSLSTVSRGKTGVAVGASFSF